MSTVEVDAPRKRNEEGSNDNAVLFNKQDFKNLRRLCRKSRSLFSDPTFPADGNALGFKELGPNSPKTRNVEWKRPTELLSKPQFFVGGANRTDVCQGELGDCWLLAAIASLTLDQDLIARVVPPDQSFDNEYYGIFHFQLWQYGEWVDVVIDDRLPTRNGKLLFVHSSNGLEFWSALLEKAYAKVHGCYEALSGGSTIEGFEDFTGGISESYDLKKAPPYLFKLIQRALGKGSLLGSSIDITRSHESENITRQKLVKGHAYSITGAVTVHVHDAAVELVRMRNPWGHVEWNGPWSDDSKEWDSVLPDEKTKLDYSAEDGEFWISYSDLLKQFSKIEICNLTPDTLVSRDVHRWNHYQYYGAWKVGSSAGGCPNNPGTYCSNPQFAFKLKNVDDNPHDGHSGCTILVGLMQKDIRKEHRDLNSIGFSIYSIPKEYTGPMYAHLGPAVLLKKKAVAFSGNYVNNREVCGRFKLPPGKYAIVPSTFEPNCEGTFILRVFAEKHVSARVVLSEKEELTRRGLNI